MNRSVYATVSLLAIAACNDPTNIGEQETDGTSGTGALGSTSASVEPTGTDATDNPSASSLSSAPTTTSDDDSTSTTGNSSGEESSSRETETAEGTNLIFLNFGGATMTAGDDNAPMNINSIGLVGELEPFQNPADVPAIVSAVEAAWTGINVVFVSERPMEGDYTMVVITPTNTVVKGALGLGRLDCDNANPNSVAAVFTDVSMDPERIAVVISRELGYAYGLERTGDDADFMNGNQVLGTEFIDGCRPLSTVPGTCPHIGCAEGEQDSLGELVARLAAD